MDRQDECAAGGISTPALSTVGDMASVIAELRAELAARFVFPASGRPRGRAIGVSRAVMRQRLDDRRRAAEGDAVRAGRVEGQKGSQAPFSVTSGEDQVVSARSKNEVDGREAQRVPRVRL